MASVRITPEEFVKAVQSSDSIKEVAQKLGMPYGSVYARYKSYITPRTKNGVVTRAAIPLKHLTEGRTNKRLDIARLTELATMVNKSA